MFRYWHRSLNPKKLIDVKFSHLSRNMTMQRTLKLHKLPDTTRTPGFRKLTEKDLPQARKLLSSVRIKDTNIKINQRCNDYNFFLVYEKF